MSVFGILLNQGEAKLFRSCSTSSLRKRGWELQTFYNDFMTNHMQREPLENRELTVERSKSIVRA